MAQVPFQMPLRGIPNTPKFSGKTPSELPQYLEDIDLLGDATVLDEVQKIKAAIRYAALDEAEVWQTLLKQLLIRRIGLILLLLLKVVPWM